MRTTLAVAILAAAVPTQSRESPQSRPGIVDLVGRFMRRTEDPAPLTVAELTDFQRQADQLDPEAARLDPKVQQDWQQLRKVLANTLAIELHAEARRFAAAHPQEPAQALAMYARAEDEVLKRFEHAFAECVEGELRAKQFPALADAAKNARVTRDQFEQRYQQVLAESDALCEAAFHPAAVEKVPWQDLLVPEARWLLSPLEGFTHRLENGVLVIEGPAASTGKEGILTIGDREAWRDFILDFELTFESGSLRMFFRMGRTVANTEHVRIESHAEGSAPPLRGKACSGEASVIGSRIRFRLGSRDIEPVEDSDAKGFRPRKGALGLVIPAGTVVRFTRLRVRVLR
jgi:hypothetical protein